ncbi:class I SAM-dependent methyltransferase [Phyllobacterium sp. LjRoot231]|uniref:class I SAM-dependent methyltransferase n=1 Tax=Phyllobacterium sp. LjRoot231 TaxID=3342289 RepID=UPI003ED0B082
MFKTEALCPICDQRSEFLAPDTYESCRDGLYSPSCPMKGCVTRERAVASVLFSLYDRQQFNNLRVHDVAPADRGMSYWLFLNAYGMTATGYFPTHKFGTTIGELQNEDLEHQTFEDQEFDVVIHLDVMEHLFDPFQALREIYRTLKPGGVCLFTTPTYDGRMKSEQVAFIEGGKLRVVGEPEYHGNPQDPTGSLVTWRYGYDLPNLIFERTGFNVEVRRWQSPSLAIMGPMTEVYILKRPS